MRHTALLLAVLGVLLSSGVVGPQAAEDISREGEAYGSAKPVRVPEKKIDVNRAGPEEIGRLPGITPQAVDRIIQNRPYKKLDDLLTKKVLGKKQFAQLREYIAVGRPKKR